MHVVFRESHGLEETETPTDLGQAPADLVVLSFSDSDLGAFAAGWHQASGGLPPLRLANLAALRHPLSVDTYVERTLAGARGILVRLIGGAAYWEYGLAQVAALARERGIALAVLPADGRPDPRLDAAATLPRSTLVRLRHLCDAGGAVAAQAALAQLALAAGLYAGPVRGAKVLPAVGAWTPEHGVACPLAARPVAPQPLVALIFYRAYVTAADLAPVEALFAALRARGFAIVGLFVPSLKAPDAARWLSRQLRSLAPVAIVNATAFSGRDGGASPLDAAGVPVFQVALSTATEADWAAAERGLSPADLAMHVVLPEVDGRVFAGVASFKAPGTRDPALQFARTVHRPREERIEAIADRVAGWTRLAARPAAERRPALVLSTYPGREWQMAHAVGLDALASAEAILSDLAGAGYRVAPGQPLAQALAARETWPLAAYRAALEGLPAKLREDLDRAWGRPEDDPAVARDAFRFAVVRRGSALVALQPERGDAADRAGQYHDLGRVPRHGYVAFYFWLRGQADAMVHIGAHGTLEWLPGKAVALSETCWPEALAGDIPVIYPFIVNDPGEAAQAKRRIGAVTLGHVPPPLRRSGTPARLARLEGLLDEFSNADGLDPRRRDRLIADIREEAQGTGIEADLGLGAGAASAEAVGRIDRFVCDVKESQFGDGLHVWGRAPSARVMGDDAGDAAGPARPTGSAAPGPRPDVPCGAMTVALVRRGFDAPAGRPPVPDDAPFDIATAAAAERQALLDALDGRRIEPGPAGSPYRGRADVLPTGRNLFTTDPRAVPTRAAHAQGVRLADELVRRHLQDAGDWPRGLVVDLWGSATMRTAGEEFAMALHLLGARPVWDEGSERVSGVEILPLAELDRPRIDVSLRISGLFRDVFPTLSALFNQAVRALAARDEAADWNPFVGAPGARVYGPAPGRYGLGLGDLAQDYGEEGRRAAGEAWLAASAWAHDGAEARPDAEGLARRVAGADAFVHVQDLPETDLLLAADYAAHEAGFAAAKAVAGGPAAALWHLDATDPGRPRARELGEEVARVVHARAAHPGWIAGMRRHGFRGAAEIAATLEHLAAFAQLAGVVGPHLIDTLHDATLGDAEVAAFLEAANPGAHAAMRARFAELHRAGLWPTRRNSILAALEPAS
jgi:cobaltochelatase CobN